MLVVVLLVAPLTRTTSTPWWWPGCSWRLALRRPAGASRRRTDPACTSFNDRHETPKREELACGCHECGGHVVPACPVYEPVMSLLVLHRRVDDVVEGYCFAVSESPGRVTTGPAW
jgi:hypothetical protein